MAVVQIIGQFKKDGSLHPAAAVTGDAHRQGDLVHDGKIHAVELVHQ